MTRRATTPARKAATKAIGRPATAPIIMPEGVVEPPPAGSEPHHWMSPKEGADRLFKVPSDRSDIQMAMLRPVRNGAANTISQMLQAKLQPREPTAKERAATKFWPVTARDHVLVRARGAPDTQTIAQLAEDFDAKTVADQRLLAVVLTMTFRDMDLSGHELMTMGATFSTIYVAPRRLTTLAVLHAPGDVLSVRPPHVHLVIFGRMHTALGWGAVHADLAEDRHGVWEAEWDTFRAAW